MVRLRLKDVTLTELPNAGKGHCGAWTIDDLRLAKSGTPPGTTQQRMPRIQQLRREVAELGNDWTNPIVGFGQFNDDLSFDEYDVDEAPVEELMSNPELLITRRGTWVEVALRGWWDGKHMEAAAFVSGLDNFRLVKATEEGEVVPCYGENDLQPHFPMAMYQSHGHFVALVPKVPQPEANDPAAAKESPAAKEPAAAKESPAVKECGDGWTVVGKNGRAKRSRAIGKVCPKR